MEPDQGSFSIGEPIRQIGPDSAAAAFSEFDFPPKPPLVQRRTWGGSKGGRDELGWPSQWLHLSIFVVLTTWISPKVKAHLG